jgi:hypothetical protein
LRGKKSRLRKGRLHADSGTFLDLESKVSNLLSSDKEGKKRQGKNSCSRTEGTDEMQ